MDKIISAKYDCEGLFRYRHKFHTVEGATYKPHHHSGYEIYILLKGTAVFMVEGTSYPLRPMDIIITRSDEMHEITYGTGNDYERVVIHFEDLFFKNADCEHYTEIFNNRKIGEGNLIDHDSVKKSELFDTLIRLEKYIKLEGTNNEPVIKGVLVEFLHQLNEFKTSGGLIKSETVKNILEYINANISDNLMLDSLAERFFISKYHLCRNFKKYTGFTVNQYITYRRIMRVRDLYREGKNLSDASLEAGFSSYSNFYKAYVKETGHAPSEYSGRKI